MTVLTPYLRKLLAKPPTLTPKDLTEALGLMVSGQTDDIQVAAFLTLLRVTAIDHTAEFVAAAATQIFSQSHKIDVLQLKNQQGYVDIVGTGGDGQNTFNVSTTSAMVGAGMGIDMCKHGGKASTSASGAGDLLTQLGVDMARVTADRVPSIVTQTHFCFLFAPVYHPMMASLAPLRKTLGIPTIFNIMGPLLNPAPLKARIIGVYAEALGPVFAEASRLINVQNGRPNARALIVWGNEALDEISPAGLTTVWDLKDGIISSYQIHPSDFGLPTHALSTVKSGTPAENAAVVRKILAGELEDGNPVLDYVLLNSAALAVVAGLTDDWKEGVELARDAISSGRARKEFEAFVKLSNSN